MTLVAINLLSSPWKTSLITFIYSWYNALHGKWYFLFPDVLKRWFFPKKNCAGIWSFLYYLARSCFFLWKRWSYALDGKWKIIFLKKNTRKYDIFVKFPEEKVFSKRAIAGHGLSYYLKRWYFFPQKPDIFSVGTKWEMTLLKKYMEILYFLCIRTGVRNVVSHPPAKKKSKMVLSHKNTSD